MNILVVSEAFKNGGLETHIYTQYIAMREKHKFVFAFGDYQNKLDLSEAKIYQQFHFSFNSTVKNFCEDVDRLVQIIEENEIDVVHVHPFYSLFPAVFAAKLTGRPIVYTIHGIMSITFTKTMLEMVLFQYMLEGFIDKIFSVSNYDVGFMNYNSLVNKTVFLPNAIDSNKFKAHKVIDNKVWALNSRLDEDKIGEIQKIIMNLDKLDIEKLCIYGKGSKEAELFNLIKEQKLEDKVELLGWKDNLYEELNGKYNGVIGIGRATIEAMVMGYPTIIIGWNKILGVVDEKAYRLAKDTNFVNKLLNGIEIDELNKQLQDVYNGNINYEFYNEFREESSSENVYKKYEEELTNIEVRTSNVFSKIFEEVKSLAEQIPETSLFYLDRKVYAIVRNCVEQETFSLLLKNTIYHYDEYVELENKHTELQNKYIELHEANTKVSIEMDWLKEEIEKLKLNDAILEEKINLKFLCYNTAKKVKRKLRRKTDNETK